MVRADLLSDSLAVFNKERGEPACGRAANYGGLFSPPVAAKFIRTIFNIEHILEKVNPFGVAEPRTRTSSVRGKLREAASNRLKNPDWRRVWDSNPRTAF